MGQYPIHKENPLYGGDQHHVAVQYGATHFYGCSITTYRDISMSQDPATISVFIVFLDAALPSARGTFTLWMGDI